MTSRLPTREDFVESPGCPDQRCAWQQFGGLTLDEAKMRFAERPDLRQEDFMFMGRRAFLYYFPVIEDHLYGPPGCDGEYEWEAWILAMAIESQYFDREEVSLPSLTAKILELADFVVENVERLESWPEHRPKIVEAWTKLADRIKATR